MLGKKRQKGGSGAPGAGSRHIDGINIIDGKTFWAGAGRSGSQSLPSPEVGGIKWMVCLVCVCVLLKIKLGALLILGNCSINELYS